MIFAVNPGAENIERVVFTIIQGAVDFPDPIAQKTCFIILSKLVELWGENPTNLQTSDLTHFKSLLFTVVLTVF